MAARVLSHEQARSFYDHFGRKQDLQRFYEDQAIEVLLRHARFESAKAVVELGCGTGRLAARLLHERLPPEATYVGFDVSPTMVELSRARVARWANRATVQLTDGSPSLPVDDDTCDRFVSTYVLDLLSEEEIRAMLSEARRILSLDGRLCLASLTFGQGLSSRLVGRLWGLLHSLNPRLVGGCRPLCLEDFMNSDWKIVQHDVVCAFGICSEVLIATAI
jgi:ubiquinone/menaquinone biosynthesis C-methylase UbiE